MELVFPCYLQLPERGSCLRIVGVLVNVDIISRGFNGLRQQRIYHTRRLAAGQLVIWAVEPVLVRKKIRIMLYGLESDGIHR